MDNAHQITLIAHKTFLKYLQKSLDITAMMWYLIDTNYNTS